MKRVSRQGHLDPDVLAEFRAGLITGRQAQAISAHLAGCAECAALRDRLAQVSAMLAAVPVPAMPDTLARRLDIALAAEKNERASVQSPSQRRFPSLPPAVRVRRFQPRMLAQAAAALVVLVGLGFGLTQLSGGSSSNSTSASSGTGRTSAGSNAPAVPARGSLSPERAAGSAESAIYVVRSDVNYQPATLRRQLTAELAARPGANSSGVNSSGANSSGAKSATAQAPGAVASARVHDCVLRLSGQLSGARLVLVESARYRGMPATVVVASNSAGERAWIVGSSCSGTDSDILASVVLLPGISAP